MTLTVVSWLWAPPKTYRSQFAPKHVNILAAMVARHYRKPHRFVCVTDFKPDGFDKSIGIIPLWKDHERLLHPFGPRNPSCYRRLRAFSAEAREFFGERFVSVDLDCVITGDLSPLWDVDDDFKIWGDTNRTTPYNGSMFMLKTGTRTKVWDTFDPSTSPRYTKKLGYFGSDQAWIAACLGKNEKRWTEADGVYSWRNHLKPRGGALPATARIVLFHGHEDPWTPGPQQFPWVRQHYRANEAVAA